MTKSCKKPENPAKIRQAAVLYLSILFASTILLLVISLFIQLRNNKILNDSNESLRTIYTEKI